jgi:uncharacterized protein YbjT (DUF2867 family)
MKVLVCGATGAVGSAVVRALRSRGHAVEAASRQGNSGWRIDFMAPVAPQAWAERLRAARIDAVVNCVGVLMARGDQRFERVHERGPIELFEGAALAGVQRVVQVSALGAGTAHSRASAYLRSKQAADEALLALPLRGTVLRPALLFGPGCSSTRLFATLASLPVVALPGGGGQALRPLHVYELAEAIARCLEAPQPPLGVLELGGAQAVSYREMLAAYRRAIGAGPAVWLPLPMALMTATAAVAEWLPQRVFCRQTVELLAQGHVPAPNATGTLLGRAPATLEEGLRVTPPEAWLDLRISLAPPVALMLRSALALMWLWTAAVSALLPGASGLRELLQRCGFGDEALPWVLAASCLLNAGIGLALLVAWRQPLVHAVQAAAIVGYTATAAYFVPGLTLDHCAPLVKNVPLLAAALLLWLALPADRPAPLAAQRRVTARATPSA